MINSTKFAQLRKEKDLKREVLAVELGVSTSAIWNVENDPKHNPSINLILKYVKYFGVEMTELVDVENTKLGNSLS